MLLSGKWSTDLCMGDLLLVSEIVRGASQLSLLCMAAKDSWPPGPSFPYPRFTPPIPKRTHFIVPALPPRLYCRTPALGQTDEASNCPEPPTGDVLLELSGNRQHQLPDNDDTPTLLSSGIACFPLHQSAHHVGWRSYTSFWQQPGTEHKSSVPCYHPRLDCWSRRRQPSVLGHP